MCNLIFGREETAIKNTWENINEFKDICLIYYKM